MNQSINQPIPDGIELFLERNKLFVQSLNLFLIIYCCLGLGIYSVISAGWPSNCKYFILGSLRAVAQKISYEVSLALILLYFIF